MDGVFEKRAKTGRVGRLAHEAAVIAALDHPNVIRAVGFDGEVLRLEKAVCSLRDPPSCHPRALSLATLVSDAWRGLRHLHARGYVHRDVKPSNILIMADGRAVIADLGLAATAEELAVEPFGRRGTPAYMSARQAADPRSVTAEDDLHSLAVTYGELLERDENGLDALLKLGFLRKKGEKTIDYLKRVIVMRAGWEDFREGRGELYEAVGGGEAIDGETLEKALEIVSRTVGACPREVPCVTGRAGWLCAGATYAYGEDYGVVVVSRRTGFQRREEVVAHELVHAMLVPFGGRPEDEFLAWKTSSSRWRQVVGPYFSAPSLLVRRWFRSDSALLRFARADEI